MIPSDWKAFNKCHLSQIPEHVRVAAVAFLRGYFTEGVKLQIRDAEKADPQTWWAEYHHFWGMGIRNLLRTNGFGEGTLGVENLDDVYVGLIEEAVLES